MIFKPDESKAEIRKDDEVIALFLLSAFSFQHFLLTNTQHRIKGQRPEARGQRTKDNGPQFRTTAKGELPVFREL
jgi:hypothetical protein